MDGLRRFSACGIALLLFVSVSVACDPRCRFSFCDGSDSLSLSGEADVPLKSLCVDGEPLRNVNSGPTEVLQGNQKVALFAFEPTGLSEPFPPHFFKVYSSSGIGHQTAQGNQPEKLANLCVIVPIHGAKRRGCVSFRVDTSTGLPHPKHSSPAQMSTEPDVDAETSEQATDEPHTDTEAAEQGTDEPSESSETSGQATDEPDGAVEAARTSPFAENLEVIPIGINNSLAVVACNRNSLLLTGKVPVGSVVVDVAKVNRAINTELCSNREACGGVFQTVVSLERADSLNDVLCPSGEECYLAITSLPTIAQFFDQTIVSNIAGRGFNTSAELGGTLLASCDIVSNSSIDASVRQVRSHADLPTSTLTAMFDKCATGGGQFFWRKFLGNCPFSNVCDNKPEKSCYYCTQNGGDCNNGCGPAWLPFKVSKGVVFDFSNACCGHDYCWDSMAFGKGWCDMAFRHSMHRYCHNEWPNLLPARVECMAYAELFYGLVALAGDGAFAESQEKQRAHLDSCLESPSPVPPSPEPDEDNDGEEASVYTDPHLVTFDGLRFDAQASGEFTLVRQPSTGLKIHGRFSGPETSGSVLTAIVLEESGSARIQLEVAKPNQTSTATVNSCPVRLFVNDVLQNELAMQRNGSSIFTQSFSSQLKLRLRSGVQASFSVSTSSHFGCYLEFFSVFLPRTVVKAGGISGLLGTPDRNPSNEWQTRAGQTLETPTTSKDKYFGGAYSYSTTNWCVTEPKDSLFSYIQGTSHSTFNLCSRPYVQPNTNGTSSELRQLCGADVQCLVDGVVGGTDMARTGLEARANVSISRNRKSRFRFQPDAVETGSIATVLITVDLSTPEFAGIPDVANVNEYRVYELGSDGNAGTSRVAVLVDNGEATSSDAVAGDEVFHNSLAVSGGTVGETRSYVARPVVGGREVTSGPLVFAALDAVTTYSVASGIGGGNGTTTDNYLKTVTGSLNGRVLSVVYSWPLDQSDLDTATSFFGTVGFNCPNSYSTDYMTHTTQDDTSAGGSERVKIDLDGARAAGVWSGSTSVEFKAGWFASRFGQGPAVLRMVLETNGTEVPSTFLQKTISPGSQSGCASQTVATLSVTEDSASPGSFNLLLS